MTQPRATTPAGPTAMAGATVAIAACGLLGVGGAAGRPGGSWLGIPSLAAALAVAAVAAAVAAVGRRGAAPAAGFLLPAAMVMAGLPLAGVRALSGPPMLALALAGAVLCVAASPLRLPRWSFLPLVFLLLLVPAGRAHVRVGPQGDEPHYLMVADSLWRDGDVSLERDYAEERYATYHDAPLAPHFRVRGRHGEVYSLHAVGLSVLILPAWAIAGYAGVTVFMAFLAALLVNEVRLLALDLTGRERLATGAALLVALTPPLAHYAGLVFTEVPAGLVLAFGLRRGREERLSVGGALAVGLAASALPWLNVRYAPLALLVVVHASWRHRTARHAVALFLPLLASAAGLAVYHHALYGFFDPRRVYGRRPEIALSNVPEALPGLLLDQEFGLLVYAPVLVLALPGLVWLVHRDRRLGWTAILASAVVVAAASAWPMWRGGFNPPGRFLVPITPVLAVAAALVWARRGVAAGAALLAGWSLWVGLAGALEPRLVDRDRDETAPFFRQLSGAREWTGLLPGFVLEDPDRRPIAVVWALALIAAVPWRERRPGAVRVAVASAGLVLAAEAAASVSSARTDDRDAVRLVGRPAVAIPGWRLSRAASAEWAPEGLGWGRLYEPYRHPEGAPLGRRLPIPPGKYRLEIDADDLSGRAGPPRVELSADEPGARWRSVPVRPFPSGLAATLEMPTGPRAWNLRLRGGGPILVRRLRLVLQPPGEGPV
jgi:hypothetical protein